MASKILIYILRRDLRLQDNPILALLAAQKSTHGFTHLLPVYVFPADQVEVSGFIPSGATTACPYPPARSRVGGFWRCGPHRAQFLAESVWDLRRALEEVGSGLIIRVGSVADVLGSLLAGCTPPATVGAVWMTAEDATEEKAQEAQARKLCEAANVPFQLWPDEKYFVDECLHLISKAGREVGLDTPQVAGRAGEVDTASVATSESHRRPAATFRHTDHPRRLKVSPAVSHHALGRRPPTTWPNGAESAHPFHGGATAANTRLAHLMTSGAVTSYKKTRNGLLGLDYSTKLSAWLALGCITARQVHEALQAFEAGDAAPAGPWRSVGDDQPGYGEGESEGTQAIRFELLWRDYMRLCTRKFGHRLFRPEGFRSQRTDPWKAPTSPVFRGEGESVDGLMLTIHRVLNGTTGMGLIDASQRELYLTGYMSNRSRQNVASFLARHLGIDWRIGAEWFECLLVDYDVSSNWGNWQYVSGVGNDPRDREGGGRIFNPVKQSYDYDPKGTYIKAWVPELRTIVIADTEADGDASADSASPAATQAAEIFQAWTMSAERREEMGLTGVEWVEKPLHRIEFYLGKRNKSRSKHKNARKHASPPTAPTPKENQSSAGGSSQYGNTDGGKKLAYRPRFARKKGQKSATESTAN